MSQAKHWCFTLNNYCDDELFNSLPARAVYLVCGKEIASTGTPHLQGYISFAIPRRLSQVKKIRPRANWSVARNIRCAPEYCKKDGDFIELGVLPSACSKSTNGRRNELCLFMDEVKEGVHDIKILREKFPNVFARYFRFAEAYLRDHLPIPTVETHPLRDWQSSLLDDISLHQSPSDRTIVFLVDKDGNSGKSWFCRYVSQESFADKVGKALVLGAGKKGDLSYAFSKCLPYPNVVLVDCPRSKMETLHYDFLEELKNGCMFSSKYESSQLRFPVPHVVVFCNEEPDMSKLSDDRYDIRII